MNIPCEFNNPCCDDQASLGNFTSEAPDRLLFKGVHYRNQIWDGDWTYTACLGLCESEISQAEADLCAAANAAKCEAASQFLNTAQVCGYICARTGQNIVVTAPAGLWEGDTQAQANSLAYSWACGAVAMLCVGLPAPNLPPSMPHRVSNQLQSCSKACGSTGYYTALVAAGTVWGWNQTDADARAASLACKNASANRACLSSIRNACKDQVCNLPVALSNPGSAPITWQIAGTLPPGTAFTYVNNVATLSGTPTAGGIFSFSLTATDALGNYTVRYYTVTVMDIATSEILPDAALDADYSETIVVTPGTYTAPIVVALEAGNDLPEGLILNPSTGEISGIPTVEGDYAFSILFTDSTGVQCFKVFALTVAPGWEVTWNTAIDNGGYWNGMTILDMPWPEDFCLATPCIWGIYNGTNPNPSDPYLWPLDWDTRTPNSPNSIVEYVGEWLRMTVDNYAEVGYPCYSYEIVYIRMRVDGGLTGKHVRIDGDYTFPGGSWICNYIDGDLNPQSDPADSFLNIVGGMEACDVFVNGWKTGPPLINIMLDQAAPASATFSFDYDVIPGEIKYISFAIWSMTGTFGPSVVNIKPTIT